MGYVATVGNEPVRGNGHAARDTAFAQSVSLSVQRSVASCGSSACFCGVTAFRFETNAPFSAAASGAVASRRASRLPPPG